VVLALPLLAVAIAVINLLALVSYTEVFKGTPGAGNALVAYLGGSTFLFGGAAVSGELTTAAVLFVLAALATFTREVIKDVEDVEGDAAEGLRTLPLAIGERRALLLGASVLVVAVLASPLPYLDGSFGLPYLALLVPADLAMLYAAYESFDDPTAGQTHVKWGMFLAAAAFVVGRLAA
jgi:geranylgeranylglycerol-phosphate geranylgeranyltransferase